MSDNIRRVRVPRFLKNPRARKTLPTTEKMLSLVESMEIMFNEKCEHKEIYHFAQMFIEEHIEEWEERMLLAECFGEVMNG